MKVFLALVFVCGLALAEPGHYNQNYGQQRHHARNPWNRDARQQQQFGQESQQWDNQGYGQQKMSFWDQKMMGFNKKLANVFGYEMKQPYYYNPSTKPDFKVPVKVSLYVRMLGPVHVEQNYLDMQLTYRESYFDKRLKNLVQPFGDSDYVTLTGEDVYMLWTPDTFFRNSIDEEFMGSIKPNQYARVYPSGKVLLSRRINLKVACPHLETKLAANEPAKCSLTVASYGYKMDDLHYMVEEDPLKLAEHATAFLGKYNDVPIAIEGNEWEDDEVETATGKYSVLHFNFTLMAKNRR